MKIYDAIEQAYRRMLTLGVKSMWAVIMNVDDYQKLKLECLSKITILYGEPTEENDTESICKIFGLKIIPCLAQPPGNIDIVDRWTAREIEEMDVTLRGKRAY